MRWPIQIRSGYLRSVQSWKRSIGRSMGSGSRRAPRSTEPYCAGTNVATAVDLAFDVILKRWAGADKMSVAVHIVDAPYRGPVFIDPEATGGKTALFSAVGSVPIADECIYGVGRVFQWVVPRITFAPFDGPDLLADSQHRGDKAIEFRFSFTLCGFHHQSPRNRPTHCRCVKTIVDQSLRNVVHGHARSL